MQQVIVALVALLSSIVGTIETQSTTYYPYLIDHCAHNGGARELAEIFENHPLQERVGMRCDSTLMRVAQARAEDMAERLYFDHTDPEGRTPNWHVLQAGYPLPYAAGGNNIESIAAGFGTPLLAFGALMLSESHGPHVLGQVDFFREQECYGVGYAENDGRLVEGVVNYVRYFVILSAPCRTPP